MAVLRRALGLGLVFLMGAATLAWPAPEAVVASRGAPPAVEQWVLHYQNSGDDIAARAFSDLLAAIAPGVRVHVVVASERDVSGFRGAVDVPESIWENMTFQVMGPSTSLWARDRYVAFERHGARFVLLPDPAAVPAGWVSDLDVGAELARDRTLGLRRIPTNLLFEGGDLVMSPGLLLTGVGTVESNVRHLHVDRPAVLRELETTFGRKVVVLGSPDGEPPHEHADMYVHLLDDQTALLGDPRLASAAWETMRAEPNERERLDWYGPCSREEQDIAAPAYERVAMQLQAAGLKVERVPAVHARYGDTLITYTNAVTEMRDGRAHAYVPIYGLPTLDRQAHDTWRRLGYVTHPIDCMGAIVEGGAIRCLTNTVRHLAPGHPATDVVQNAPTGRTLRLLEPVGR